MSDNTSDKPTTVSLHIDPKQFLNLSRVVHDMQLFDGDDKRLVWSLYAAFCQVTQLGSAAARVLTLIAKRLYPEFDGRNVRWEEWGWSLPDGQEIRYDTDLPKEGT